MCAKCHVIQKGTVIARRKAWYRGPIELVCRLAGVVFIDHALPREKNFKTINEATEFVIKENVSYQKLIK